MYCDTVMLTAVCTRSEKTVWRESGDGKGKAILISDCSWMLADKGTHSVRPGLLVFW